MSQKSNIPPTKEIIEKHPLEEYFFEDEDDNNMGDLHLIETIQLPEDPRSEQEVQIDALKQGILIIAMEIRAYAKRNPIVKAHLLKISIEFLTERTNEKESSHFEYC